MSIVNTFRAANKINKNVMFGYVYLTRDLSNGKLYVGKHQSSKISLNYHGSGAKITKIKNENLETTLLATGVDLEHLAELEEFFISYYNTADPEVGYNIRTRGGDGGWYGKDGNNINSKKSTTKKSRQEKSPMCIEFYLKKGMTEEEAKEAIEKHKELLSERCKDKTSVSIQYWLDRGFSEEEAKEKVHKRQQTFSLEVCIEKYGEVEGRKRWQERQEKYSAAMKGKNKGRIYVNNGNERHFIKPEELETYLAKGYKKGWKICQ